jgi:ABC-type sugar transport system ATPase subunit
MPELTVTEGTAGLRAVNLRKSYRKRPVIRDVSLRLDRGEVVALLGPNGSGKTTCFYAIAGLITPEGGQVIIDGRDVTMLPMYRRARLGIGYLPQEVSIFRGLSVEDNILAILEIGEPNRGTPVGILDHPPAPRPGTCPLGRRKAAGRNRTLPRSGAEIRPSRRTLCRRGSDRRG